MQNTRKRLFQGLLLCSPLSILSLQAAPMAISLPELGPLLRRPDLEESLPLPAYQACSKLVQTRKQHGRNAANQQLGALTSQWLNQFGQAAVIFNDRLSESTLQTGRLALLLPLYEQSQQLLLTQWGVLRDHQQTTLNVGVGQRCFNQAQGYWGYHVFYDYRRQGNHGRLGLGLEQRSASRSVAVNGYLPVSGWRIAEDQTTQSRPAKGIDLRLQQQLPQHPQLQLTAVLEHYFARSLAPEDAQQPPPRPTAFTLGLDYTPLPLLTTSYAYQLASGGQRNHQLQLTLIYRLGVPLLQQLDPTQVAQAQSLAGSRYALIQRHSQIVLEQRAYEPPAKADQAQAPQDTLQIELPNEQQQGEPGKSLTVPIKLSSSCALNAWQFTGEGDFITQGGGTPKVDFEQQQLILTLPDQPGEYSLEIVASKAQGVTTRSNTLQVRVQAAEVEKVLPQPEEPTVSPQPETQSEPPAPQSSKPRSAAPKQVQETGSKSRGDAAKKSRRPAADQTSQNQDNLDPTQVTTDSEDQTDWRSPRNYSLEESDEENPKLGGIADGSNEQPVRHSLLEQPTAHEIVTPTSSSDSTGKDGQSAEAYQDSQKNNHPLVDFDDPRSADSNNAQESDKKTANSVSTLPQDNVENFISFKHRESIASIASNATEKNKLKMTNGIFDINSTPTDTIALYNGVGEKLIGEIIRLRKAGININSVDDFHPSFKATITKLLKEHHIVGLTPETDKENETPRQEVSFQNLEHGRLNYNYITKMSTRSSKKVADRSNEKETAQRISTSAALVNEQSKCNGLLVNL